MQNVYARFTLEQRTSASTSREERALRRNMDEVPPQLNETPASSPEVIISDATGEGDGNNQEAQQPPHLANRSISEESQARENPNVNGERGRSTMPSLAKITIRKAQALLKVPDGSRGAPFYNRVEQVLDDLNRDMAQAEAADAAIDELFNLWETLGDILDAACRVDSDTEENDNTQATSNATSVQKAGRKPTAKDMDPFDGRASSWSTFSTLFKEIILDNKTGSETLKLSILAELVPQHKELVKAHTTCAEALATLSPQYSSSTALWSDIISDLQQVPVLTDKSGVKEWQRLESAILRAQRCIDPTELAFLVQAHVLLKGKLGPLWKQYNFSKDNKNLKDLLVVVTQQIEGLRTAEMEKVFIPQVTGAIAAVKTTKPKSRFSYSPVQQAITAVTVHQPNAARNNRLEPCYFCGQDHLRVRCHLNRVERQRALERSRRCLKCLQPQDGGHQCAGGGCKRCHSALHSLICPCPPVSANPSRQHVQSRPPPPPPPPSGNARFGNSTPFGGATGALGASSQQSAAPHHAPPSNQGTQRSAAYVIAVDEHVTTAVEEPQEVTLVATDPHAVFLPTLKLYSKNPDTSLSLVVRTLLDEASTTSFISESVVAQLGLDKNPVTPFTVGAFGGMAHLRICWETTLTIQSVADPRITSKISVYVMSGILVGKLPAATAEFLDQAKRHGIHLTDYSTSSDFVPIDLLIGQDLYNDTFLLPLQRSYKFQKGMAFVNSRFGWTLQGAVGGRRPRNLFVNCAYISTGPESDLSLAKYLSFTERTCICEDLTKLLHDPWTEAPADGSKNDWVKRFEGRLVYDEVAKRYVAALPWYGDKRPAPNYSSALAQCLALRNRLDREGRFQDYDNALQDLVKNGYARILDRYDKNEGYGIPHFPVYKATSRTTPTRPVFNASASMKGEDSLNSCIFKGIWDQVQLVEILIRWRLHPIALLADIRKAFLQIRINPEDCKYLRFFWFYQGRLRMFEMKSLLFGASASPFILYCVLKHLFESQGPDVIQVIKDTYMDDSFLLAKSLDNLQALLKRVIEVMAHASFSLHKWVTLPHVAKALGLEPQYGRVSCLGVQWDLDNDRIVFDIPTRSTAKLTRRSLASDFAKNFDPLGLLGPYHTRVKIFFREMISSAQDWDEEVKPEAAVEALSLLDDMKYLRYIAVPRLAKPSDDFEYWLFGDASSYGYGVTIYVFDCNTQRAELLLSRGHIAAKKKTIPQLELVAALLLAETFDIVRRCFPEKPARIRYFTDSQVTWHRIRSDPSKHEAFVATRITRLLELSSPDCWYYIPSEFNPADVISRGCSLRLLRFQKLWFQGPSLEVILNSERQTQLLIDARVHSVYTLFTVQGNEIMERLVNCMSHNTLRWFFYRMMTHMHDYVDLPLRFKLVTGQEVSFAVLVDIFLWKWIQAVVIPDEIAAVKAEQPLPASSPLKGLPLKLDDFGILRLDKRIEHSDLPYEVKFPLVLVDSPAVRNYIKYIHVSQACHTGSHTTEYFLKQCIYVPNSCRIVHNVVWNCLTCRRYRTGKAFSVPMAPLPLDRVTRGFAFEVVGIDIAGPIHNDLGRLTKFYILIFVCLKSRAVHLEVIETRETAAIMRAYKRFTGIFGAPRKVWSDNELGFKKLNKTLSLIYERYREAMQKLKFKYGSRTEWRFNVPEAPWQGGSWERLIQTVKRTMDRARLATATTYERVLTVIRECQRFMNSRPLLHRADSAPLTPAHLVFARPLETFRPLKYPIQGEKDDVLVEYARLQQDLDSLWSLWTNQYLTSLRNYQWPTTAPPQVNELVIIKDDNVPRYHWKLGTITRVAPSPDGHYRTATVQLVTGELRTRAIHKLIPIERSLVGEDVVERLDH